MDILLGRASPSQTLPPGGGMGKPGFPIPLLEGQALSRAGRGETRFPHPPVLAACFQVSHGILAPKQVVPGRASPSQTLPPGEGLGKPGFPRPLRKGCALPNPPAGGGMGEPGSPMFTLGGVRPGNLRAGDAGADGVGAGLPRPYAGPPPGRGCAPQTFPPAGGMGKPGFPIPSQTLPRAGAGGAGLRPAGVAMALILAMTRQARRSYLV